MSDSKNTPTQDSNNTARDIYADPKLEEAKADDPVYDLIKEHWKQFATTVVAILVGIYFIQTFQESYKSSMETSSDLFQRLQVSFKDYQSANVELKNLTSNPTENAKPENAEKITDLNKKISESKSQVEQLINSAADSREPYKSFSALYNAYLYKESSPAISKEILKPISDWKNADKADSSERLLAELAALQLAKSELESPENRENGIDILKELITDGVYTSVSAAKILISSSNNDTEKAAAKEKIESLIQKHPEQSDLLRDLI